MNTPDDIKLIVHKTQSGDPLTDSELLDAIKFYTQLEASLAILGKEFMIARSPIIHTLHALEGFRDAREINRRRFGKKDTLLKLIRDTEAAHFRTVEDTGANMNAILLWNIVRNFAGLPSISKDDLAAWDGERYTTPESSKLLTNIS